MPVIISFDFKPLQTKQICQHLTNRAPTMLVPVLFELIAYLCHNLALFPTYHPQIRQPNQENPIKQPDGWIGMCHYTRLSETLKLQKRKRVSRDIEFLNPLIDAIGSTAHYQEIVFYS